MRNYFKILCLRLYPAPFDPFTFYVVFGADDDSLSFYKRRLEAFIGQQLSTPAGSQIIWFELNEENFVRLLNIASGQIWGQTRLNDVFPIDPSLESLYDMTRVKAEGSPRKEWSGGH